MRAMKKLFSSWLMFIVALLIFLNGFLKIQNVQSSQQAMEKEESIIHESWNKPLVSKTVLMIIDGLRMDHLINNDQKYMKYVMELMEKNNVSVYSIKTETPTVTLPRIKSILTGSIPAFMDVIFNFMSKKLLETNLVQLWKDKGYKINFFGDDTWLKLFPSTFSKEVGVPSFFVSDYVKVDHDVSRPLEKSLQDWNWDVMILHYLGLDHIGHLRGPTSKLVRPKLKEMDRVVRVIHQTLHRKGEPFVFLVCGDHGMSDGGGHGGASLSEIMTSGAIFTNVLTANQSFQPTAIHQVDLASTLASFTGVAIPDSNIGRPLKGLSEKFPLKKRVATDEMLAKQLISHAIGYMDPYEKENIIALRNRSLKLLKNFVEKCELNCTKEDYEGLRETYDRIVETTTDVLKEHSHSYDMTLILGSLVAIFIGNSNSLSTVKLDKGFQGTPIYAPVIHGFLIVLFTFGAKIIVYTYFIRKMLSVTKSKNVEAMIRTWFRMQLLTLCVYLCVVAILRHHLFIWSVFAPKLLYECCHFLVLLVVTAVYWGVTAYSNNTLGYNKPICLK